MDSLQILQTESHPNSHNQGPTTSRSGAKEGFSIYGLFHHHARTPQGKHLLRQCFLRPSTNIGVINERLNSITAFLLPSNVDHLEEVIRFLKPIKNMRKILQNLRKGVDGTTQNTAGGTSVPIWSSLLSFSFYALRIRDLMQEMSGVEQLAIHKKILDTFVGENLARLGRSIVEVIDLEESKNAQKPVVKANLDTELDELKRQYHGLESWLLEVAKHIKSSLPSEYQGMEQPLEVGYYPRIGYVIQVPVELSDTLERFFESIDRPWQLVFTVQ